MSRNISISNGWLGGSPILGNFHIGMGQNVKMISNQKRGIAVLADRQVLYHLISRQVGIVAEWYPHLYSGWILLNLGLSSWYGSLVCLAERTCCYILWFPNPPLILVRTFSGEIPIFVDWLVVVNSETTRTSHSRPHPDFGWGLSSTASEAVRRKLGCLEDLNMAKVLWVSRKNGESTDQLPKLQFQDG